MSHETPWAKCWISIVRKVPLFRAKSLQPLILETSQVLKQGSLLHSHCLDTTCCRGRVLCVSSLNDGCESEYHPLWVYQVVFLSFLLQEMNLNHGAPQHMGATGGYDNDVFLDTSVDSFMTFQTDDTLTASSHSRHRWGLQPNLCQ